MAKKSAVEVLKKRVQDWEKEYAADLFLTEHRRKILKPIQSLSTLFINPEVIGNVLEKAFQKANAAFDKKSVFFTVKFNSVEEACSARVDRCDQEAELIHKKALKGASKFSSWDECSPLELESVLVSLFTLSFETIRRVGLCFGYERFSEEEKYVCFQILGAASSIGAESKKKSLKSLQSCFEEGCDASLTDSKGFFTNLSSELILRRALGALPVIEDLCGGYKNAWFLDDIAWAARNVFAKRRFLNERKDQQTDLKTAA